MSEIIIKAEEIFKIGSYVITNSLLLSFAVLLFLSILAIFLRKNVKLIPGKIQNVFEMIIEFLLSIIDSVLGEEDKSSSSPFAAARVSDRKKSEKYLPLIATIFLFVLISNWFGLLPGIGSIFVREGSSNVPLFRSPAGDLNFTLALAIVAVLSTNFLGIVVMGFFTHIKKFFNFGSPINFFVGILELMSELSKVVSFSFRLFGNIFAGEVLLIIMTFLMPYVLPVPFLMMEIFFGAIQAFIFAMLTLVFLSVHTIKTEH
ncbi:MAG: FoF1 ATP synthase subunit a, partial [bacterium]|nr:FoF1 ATP synthase subunit a [bacterium]